MPRTLKWLVAVFIIFLGKSITVSAGRFKIPGSTCGKAPNTHLCDALPVGIEEQTPDNGTGRSPHTCVADAYCPYGMVTYGFGNNEFGQLGLGDTHDRILPTPLATAYAKVQLLDASYESSFLLWEGIKTLFSWGRADHGQLGQGVSSDNFLPNQISGFIGPLLVKSGSEHTLVTDPPVIADFFQYDDFSSANDEFVHYGASSQPIAPDDLCPRCVPWEKTPQPHKAKPQLRGYTCFNPDWSLGAGIVSQNEWCYIGQFDYQPCKAAEELPNTRIPGTNTTWWWTACIDLAKFSLTPDPPVRLAAGAVWRKEKVQIYQAWRMTTVFSIKKNDEREGGGDGFVAVIQNNGISPSDHPIGQRGMNLGIARSTRTSFSEGIPNSLGIEVRIARAAGDAALEVRACSKGPFTVDNTGINRNCQLAVSYWRPTRTCNQVDPATCCSPIERAQFNTCFIEDVADEGKHQLTIEYAPFALQVFIDDLSSPKLRFDFDIRTQISSYICQGGTFNAKRCKCNGDFVCGGVQDLTTCGAQGTCVIDGTAWVGFTASTGDAFSVFEIHSWNFLNLAQEGAIYAFGSNVLGQLGLNDKRDRNLPNLMASLDGFFVVSIGVGTYHTVILNQLGAVYVWGGNSFGQLGQGDLQARDTPVQVSILNAMSQSAAAGDPCVCAAQRSGNCQNLPAMAPCKFTVVSVSAGAFHSLAVVERDNDAHEIWGWGDNSFGQLGCLELPSGIVCPWIAQAVGTRGNYPTKLIQEEPCSGSNPRCMTVPRRISSFDRFGQQAMIMKPQLLVSGAFHNVLITAECTNCPLPSVCSRAGLTRDQCDCDGGARSRSSISRTWIIQNTECIAKKNELYTWGSNLRGQLGNNCTNYAHQNYRILDPHKNECPDSFVPIRLNSNRSIHLLPYYPLVFPFSEDGKTMTRFPTTAAAGHHHTLLLMSDNSLFAWGDNTFGQLGLGDNAERVYPVLVTFFSEQYAIPPNVGPLDGGGRSITEERYAMLVQQRPVKVIAAGKRHSLVATNCVGGGFKDDNSCDCKFGWKGPDCSIECNGGSNNSCSGHGTFDTINHLGDRTTCKAYLRSISRTRCVGLKSSVGSKGCPGLLTDGCPSVCRYCDEELYDCENDGTCNCISGFTGPDCSVECVPTSNYHFLPPLGGLQATFCTCTGAYSGQYCNISRDQASDTSASSQTKIITGGAGNVKPEAYKIAICMIIVTMILVLAGSGRILD